MDFKIFIKRLLPYRFYKEDTNLDAGGVTLIERFLEIFGDEINVEIYPKIEELLDVTNAILTPIALLDTLANTLGDPPLIIFDNANKTNYRKLLSNLTWLNKIKGTQEGYRALFRFLELEISTFTVVPPDLIYYDSPDFKYDSDLKYDAGCYGCFKYELDLYDSNGRYQGWIGNEQPGDTPLILARRKTLLYKLIRYNEPINSHLSKLWLNGYPLDITEYWDKYYGGVSYA